MLFCVQTQAASSLHTLLPEPSTTRHDLLPCCLPTIPLPVLPAQLAPLRHPWSRELPGARPPTTTAATALAGAASATERAQGEHTAVALGSFYTSRCLAEWLPCPVWYGVM